MFKKWIRDSRIGYISGQAGIMRRMLREEGAWQNHLEFTSKYIQQVVKTLQPKSVRILGSGWLLDIPIKFLVENCGRVVLADIFHPNQIINKYKDFKNIEFDTIDITGGIVDLCYKQRRKDFSFDAFVQQIENSVLLQFSEELVISANLLSQLSVMLTNYLSSKVKVSDEQIERIAEVIQRKHIELLSKSQSVIISDYEEEYFDEEGKFIGSKPSIFINLPDENNRKEWTWNFDTKMYYKEDCITRLRVVALTL